MAGAVVTRTDDPFRPDVHYVDVARPLLTIPNLAIHMNRQINEGVALDKQKHMLPLFMMCNDKINTDSEWREFLSELVNDRLRIFYPMN